MSIAWPEQIYQELKSAQIKQVAFVPDAGHSQLIRLCEADPAMRAVSLTTEEEGVAMLAGAWLGGERGVLLMQSSGVGNCINMISMQQEHRMPLLSLVTMRGEWGEFNPQQVPMGKSTQAVLEAAGAYVYRCDDSAQVAETIRFAAALTFNTSRVIVVLIGQRVVGAKNFLK
jgi:sulfopyruvate decarboxylase alpha subunit